MSAIRSANRRRWRQRNRPALDGLIIQAIEFRDDGTLHTFLYTLRAGLEVRHTPKDPAP